MERRVLPHSGLEVAPLCLGTMTFGTPVAQAEAVSLTQRALDLGINFIDTANMYEGYTRRIGSPGGISEEILGQALRGRREQAVVATKVGMKIGPTEADEGLSRAHIRREIERSLARLGTDTIDLYYMHRPYPAVPLEESVGAFQELLAEGKARAWGISNFSAAQTAEVLQVCDANGWRRPAAVQPAYSLLKRDIEQDLLPLCQREELAVIPYQVLQGGVLSGKYQYGEPPPPGSRQVEKPEWTMVLSDELFERLGPIEAEAHARGRTLLQHALLSLLEQPAVVSLIIGVKRVEQIEAAVQALG